MSSAFSSVDEAVTFFDAHENFPGVWLANCPSCQREGTLAISVTWDHKVGLGCQVGCTDSEIGLAVIAKRNRTGAITATGTVTAPNGIVGTAEPTTVSGTGTTSGTALEHPQAAAIADSTSVQLTGDQVGLPADTERGYQWLSPLGDAEYVALRESILTLGVMVPVVVDEHGSVIDGYHRVKVCLELGLDWPRTVLSGLSESEKWDRARDLNDARRHLTASERKALLVRLNERMGGLSLRVRSGKLGVSRETVRRMDAQSGSGVLSDTPEPDAFRTGTDGKRYQATRPKQATATESAGDKASASVPEVDKAAPVGSDGLARVSVDTSVSTELVSNSPDRDVQPPAALRQSLFDIDNPPSMEVSTPIGRKAGKGAGKRSPADVMARTTDLTKIVSQLGEWLDFAGINALISLLQDESRRLSIRVVPNPGQTSFM